MRRPRHREKNNLLWKMLGIAGVINLVLWPILIHEGVFAGIRQEVLIPVRLISLPPSHKPPDVLQKVARIPTPSHVSVPSASSAPRRSPTRPKSVMPQKQSASKEAAQHQPPSVTLLALKTSVKVPTPAPHRLTARTSVPQPVSLSGKEASEAKRPAQPHVAHVAQKETSAPVRHPVEDVRQRRTAPPELAARLARAKQLEAEGHQVAEWLAQQRSSREASLPPPSSPMPANLPEPPDAPLDVHDTMRSTEPALTTHEPSPLHKDQPVLLTRMVPAAVVWKAYPAVPDSMMKSAWHATFHGQFTIQPDGRAVVQMVSSTGFSVLDRRAMQAARRWKFRPARLNGKSVMSHQPFAFEYNVHPIHSR